MHGKYGIKNINLRKHFIILGCIILSTFLLGIGYAAVDAITLSIDGRITAEPINELIIADVKYNAETSTNPDIVNSIIREYYQTMMRSTITLSEDNNSSITYNISIYNGDICKYSFKEVEYLEEGELYDNPNIVWELNGLQRGQIIDPLETIDFSITFSYLNNVVPENRVLNSLLKFKFEQVARLEDVGISVNSGNSIIYNLEQDTIRVQIANENNNNDIRFKLKSNNVDLIAATDIIAGENLSLDINIYDVLNDIAEHDENITMLSLLSNWQSNREYSISLELIQPEEISLETNIKFSMIPTMTNCYFGLRDAGTQSKPYIIYKVEDFVRFAEMVSGGIKFENQFVKQINDIDFNKDASYYKASDTSFGDLNGIPDDNENGIENDETDNQIKTEMTTGTGFPKIGTKVGENDDDVRAFWGIYDGKGYKIKNLYIKESSENAEERAGLFAYLYNATIKDLSIYGRVRILSDGAAFIGGIYGETYIINCHNYANVTNTKTGLSVGGLIGAIMPNSEVSIQNSSNRGNITNGTATAGLIGFVWDSSVEIVNCCNTGTIWTKANTGWGNRAAGLVLRNTADGSVVISKSYNVGEVKAGTDTTANGTIGGLIAYAAGTLAIDKCYNIGPITRSKYAGGLIGTAAYAGNTIYITNSYNAGIFDSTTGSTAKGGLIGNKTAGELSITNSYYMDDGETYLQVGNIANVTTGRKTSNYMKTTNFVDNLGNTYFKMDTGDNGGYPVLKENDNGIEATAFDPDMDFELEEEIENTLDE